MLLNDLLLQTAAPESPAVVFEGVTLSRGQLAQRVDDLASRFDGAGIGPGAKVLVALPNVLEFLTSFLAVNVCGGVFVPVNPRLMPSERDTIDRLAQPDFVISKQESVEALSGVCLSRTNWVRNDQEDLSQLTAIILTSGTTGGPKGVMMTEDALVSNARAVAGYLDLSSEDQTLVFLPLYYTYTLSQIFSTWLAGGSVVLMRNLLYPSQALTALADHGITGFGGVPTSLNLLVSHQAASRVRARSLRYVLSAGGPLAPAVIEKLGRAFPGVALFNNYGCTEIGPRATAVNLTAHPDRTGSIGRPISGVNLTIVRSDLTVAEAGEVGEIVLGGASLMKGYYRDPDTTVARMSHHGFHTGDYAFADLDGFVYFQGRRDDLFKSGGEKISAREIEDVMIGHPAVGEAAVVSQPDPLLGAVPVAYIVLSPGKSCTAARAAGVLRRSSVATQSAANGAFRRGAPQDSLGQDSETSASGNVLAMKTGLSSAVAAATVPWGCWSLEETLQLPLPERFSVRVNHMRDSRALSADELAQAMGHTFDSKSLGELAIGARTAVIAVDDITRPTPTAEILPLLLSALDAIPHENIRILIALGAHRPMVRSELVQKLGVPILEEFDIEQHHPYENLVDLGRSSRGTPIRLNRTFCEADSRIAVGSVVPHPYMGFGGGAKIVVPGLAGIDTLQANHQPAVTGISGGLADPEVDARRDIEEIALRAGLQFSCNVVVNSRREIAGVFCGHPISAHRAAAAFAKDIYATTATEAPYDVVCLNAYPKDGELLQVGNAFNCYRSSSRPLLKDNGTLVVTACCQLGKGYHSLHGRGMRLHRPPIAKPYLNGCEIAFFSPHINERDFRVSFAPEYRLFTSWDALTSYLEQKHAGAASVGVFPTAPLQLVS